MFNQPHRHRFDRVVLVIRVSTCSGKNEFYRVLRCLRCRVGLKLECVPEFYVRDFIKKYPESTIALKEKEAHPWETELIRAGTVEWDNLPPYKDLTKA